MHMHRYTDEEKAFFLDFIPGHTYLEIQQAFTKRFGWDITIGQVKGYMGNHRISSGTKGRFERGHIPANKGKKGVYASGCEKTWFHKGHIPKNHRETGSERINVDGYTEVKVSEPNKWRLKHLVIWENANGPVTKVHCVIFLDGNKQNIELDNLMMIPRKHQVRMNQNGLFSDDREITIVGANMAGLMSAVGEAKRARKSRGKKRVVINDGKINTPKK